MTKEGVVEKEILEDVHSFCGAGIDEVDHGGNEYWAFMKKIKNNFVEAFTEEVAEVGAGIAITGLVSAMTGGSILLPGAIGFATAVVLDTYRKTMQKKAVAEKVAEATNMEV